MASMTDYLEALFLKHATGNAAWTMPTTVYAAIHTADPTESGASNEAVGGSYARQSFVPLWNAGSTRIENTSAITFTNMPSGTFSHISIKDASSGGNSLFYGAFTSPQTLTAGQSLIIAAGDLRITAD